MIDLSELCRIALEFHDNFNVDLEDAEQAWDKAAYHRGFRPPNYPVPATTDLRMSLYYVTIGYCAHNGTNT